MMSLESVDSEAKETRHVEKHYPLTTSFNGKPQALADEFAVASGVPLNDWLSIRMLSIRQGGMSPAGFTASGKRETMRSYPAIPASLSLGSQNVSKLIRCAPNHLESMVAADRHPQSGSSGSDRWWSYGWNKKTTFKHPSTDSNRQIIIADQNRNDWTGLRTCLIKQHCQPAFLQSLSGKYGGNSQFLTPLRLVNDDSQ